MLVSVPLRGNGCETQLRASTVFSTASGVSVPLRGNGCETASFINQALHLVPDEKTFPSPCGVMGVKLELLKSNRSGVSRFPSPCGVMGVKRSCCIFTSNGFKASSVSVPLRGNGCETTTMKLINGHRITATVSVPLRGNGCETTTQMALS